MSQVSLQELKASAAPAQTTDTTPIGFETVAGFVALQRMGSLFTKSSIVPDTFRGDANLGNAVIALDMAMRMKANPLAIMQNIYIVHGRPAWSSQFLIATLNKSGKFSALRYVFEGKKGTDSWGCKAVATELATGKELEGTLITMDMANKEGWTKKAGSKWLTMPDHMLRYRAATFFVREYAPEIAMGLPEASELEDTIDVTPVQPEEFLPETSVEEIAKKARRTKKAAQPEQQSEVVVEEAPASQPDAQPEAQQAAPEEDMTAPYECPKEPDLHPLASYCASCQDRQGCPAWG